MTKWDKDAVEAPHTQRELGIVTDTSKEALDALMKRLMSMGIQCCDMAADAITALRAENDALRQQAAAAAEAAAYERAATGLKRTASEWSCGHDARHCDCRRDIEQWEFAADEVRALITPEAASALAAERPHCTGRKSWNGCGRLQVRLSSATL